MAQAVSVTDVYDFETLIEQAAASALGETGYPVYRSDTPAVERPLPRIEVAFTVGGELGHDEMVGSERVPNAWRGTLAVMLLARSNDTETLRFMRATVRNLAGRFESMLDVRLLNHSILKVESIGATAQFESPDGWLGCTLRFSVDFAVLPGLLSELAGTTA